MNISLPSAVVTSMGRTIRLGKQLGKGGEGIVYEANGQPDVALKIYLPEKRTDRRDKIAMMVSAGWHSSTKYVAFPLDILFGPKGEFIGFAMRRLGGHKPVHQLYSPAGRKDDFPKADFRFLLRTALNISRAIASVHVTGCVIGDLNPDGVQVSQNATVTLIDSDSFQVSSPNRLFLCTVGVPEFTPPELQGKKFSHTKRTPNHDAFGLAVLIFQLMFMGRHPFSGRYSGSGDMPLQRAISEYRFAYSKYKHETGMDPPPNVPLLSDFPSNIAEAFERAFGKSGAIGSRPSATEWVSILETAEKTLIQCSANSAHHFFKGSKLCPWCQMEQAIPGFIAFNSVLGSSIGPTFVDPSNLVAAIARIADPGPPPDISQIIFSGNLKPSPKAYRARSAQLQQYFFGTALAVGGILVIYFKIQALIGLACIGGGIYFARKKPDEVTELLGAKEQAAKAWRSAADVWSRQTGNKQFLDLKLEASMLVKTLQSFPDREKYKLQELEKKKREAQLIRFLERYRIAPARIRKIGSGRKLTLASFGIETAAHVQKHRIQTIQGFGPSLANELLAWRKSLEQKFSFNASEPLNPADISQLKREISQERSLTETKLRQIVGGLQASSASAIAQRKNLVGTVNSAFNAYQQTQLDERTATSFPDFKLSISSSRVWGLASFAALLWVIFSLGSQPKIPPVIPPSNVKKETLKQISPQPIPMPSPSPSPKLDELFRDMRPETPKINKPIETTPPDSEKRSAGEDLTAPVSTINNEPINSEPSQVLPPLPPPIEIKPQIGNFEWSSNLNHPEVSPVQRVSSFLGGWAVDANQCKEAQGNKPPLLITSRRAEAFGAFCNFNSVQPLSNAEWRVQAVCSVEGKSWAANIKLAINKDSLIWTSERGTTIYIKCDTSQN